MQSNESIINPDIENLPATEQELIKLLLTKVKNGEASIDEAANLLRLECVHLLEIEQLKSKIQIPENQKNLKKPRGRPRGKTQHVLERNKNILALWIDWVEEGQPMRGGKAFMRGHIAKWCRCDPTEVDRVVAAWNGYKKGIDYLKEQNIKIVHYGLEREEELLAVIETIARYVRVGRIKPETLDDGGKVIQVFFKDGGFYLKESESFVNSVFFQKNHIHKTWENI
ncbi:hypothetical protein [uncultured Thiothrix sp.]|uniref:hypothetical protein n=1 Tax=uncultured Thiothrix sp. TaxID=223185 RepID=UPI002603AFDA|nr:hypothetical protein [uncultured Thiothrix sp.]